jgi:hypothetical protein
VIATAPATVRVLVTPVDGQPSVVGENYESNMQRMNSVFPGRYRVMQGGGGPAGSFVAAVMWGGRDVSGQVIDLAPGTAPFQMVYRPGLGKVTGTVNLGETKSEAASVFLISRESNENFTYRQVSCSQGGAFDFGEIPPGDYYAVAFDHAADRDGPPAADLQAAMLPLASSVRVDSGATATVELRLNRWPW